MPLVGGLLDGRPAASLNRFSQGEVVYLGSWADDVLADALLAWLLPRAEIEPVATVPAAVKVMRRAGEGREFVFLLNFGDTMTRVKLSGTGYTDALTDGPVAQELRLAPREVRILRK